MLKCLMGMAGRISTVTCFIFFFAVTIMVILNKLVAQMEIVKNTPTEYKWIVHGMVNILGYSTLFVPGYLTYKYVCKVNYMGVGGDSICVHAIQSCFGEEESSVNLNHAVNIAQRTTCQQGLLILYHFVGLQVSYLTWGVLQEKVMTQEYHSKEGESEYFKDSQFLVFVNRVLAFCMSGIYILYKKQTRHRCPMYKYSFCSFSNIMSSWCQYEALKYVSFPHQVLAKAAKTIPVMIMGKLISKTTYEYYEYATSVILSIGMLMFMLDVGNDHASSVITTFSGAVLLLFYIMFDSFTSNWQGALFKSYNIKPIQMMCYVNFYSCILTSVSLLQQGAFLNSLNFMLKYPEFTFDCIMLSICSASGQLFIFSTIAKFGPLIFAIITTIRQGFSVLLSCIIYNHPISISGVLGVLLVFLSVLLRIYCGHRKKNLKISQSVKQQKISV